MRQACRLANQAGSTLVITLGCIALLAISAAYTLHRVSPRLQAAGQFAAWQEAHLAAEAGVDVALQELKVNATGFQDGNWSGWMQDGPTGPIPASPTTLRQSTFVASGGNGQIGKAAVAAGLATKGPGNGYGKIGKSFAGTGSVPTSSLTLSIDGSAVVSDPIYLDNLQMVAAGNRPTNTDVQLWAVYPTPSPYYRWFRIRSMATCAIPSVATAAATDKLDNMLRRYSLRNIRPQLKKDDVGSPMTVPTPNTSRIVEALVEPLLPFEVAILTQSSMSLGASGSWLVDSFDSSDANKSNDGLYPGKDSGKTLANAAVATNAMRPVQSPYGPLISVNGSIVRGTIATNGGDDPGTDVHENLDGAIQVDPSRVRSDFYRELKLFGRPTSGIFLNPPSDGASFIAGTLSQPTQYLVSGNLHAFSVTPESPSQPAAVIIAVNGNLDIVADTITVPPNVVVILYIRGNVDFHDRPINAAGKAEQLQIYGEDSKGDPRTLSAFGDATITAAFYGPQYDVKLMDNVQWFGAVVGRSFSMLGGGSGGFHYDEALGIVGAPIGFRIARYIEDVRE